MKRFLKIASVAAALLGLTGAAQAANLDKLKVLYIGEPGTPRARHFTGFVGKNVGKVEAVSRKDFKPADADEFDVVLLDWPQSQDAREERKARPPLGERAAWSKPTVLLGSAGLNLAVVWKVRGGSG
jgi:hypothetical protein